MQLRSKMIVLIFGFVGSIVAYANPNGKVKTLQSGEELQLSGMGISRQYHQDFYIAALYQGNPTHTVSGALSPENPKRMEIRIATDSLSARKFHRYWGQLINMNNKRADIANESAAIKTFLSSFKQRLYFGDRFIFEFEPAKGTTIAYNDKVLEKIPGDAFYQILLNAWLGPKPPSKKFKAGLLGQNSNKEAISLMTAYVSTDRDTGQALTQQND